MLKHYVEYLYSYILFSGTSVSEISERDVSKVKIPNNYCGFRFFDRTEIVEDGEILIGDRKNISGWYYEGEKMTLKQVEDTYGNNNNRIFIADMKNNGISTVVKTKSGQFRPLFDKDKVI